MDQIQTESPLPAGWAEALERARADVAAGRVHVIDTAALCAEIEAEADELERRIAARATSPA
jgi:hypothetical protein